jgi:transposase
MKKRTYRKVSIKSISSEQVLRLLGGGQRLVLAVDVAKVDMVAALVNPQGQLGAQVLLTLSWKHPTEQPLLTGLLRALQEQAVVVEAVIESSGSYGDALRAQLRGLGIEVYRVSTHRSHDAAEVYDGVPSLHDAKSAHILAKLHLDGASQLWPLPSEAQRVSAAAITALDHYNEQHQRDINRLEALLARHWPELLLLMQLGTATQLGLLAEVGGPAQVSADSARALKLMERISHGLLKPEVAQAVVDSAQHSIGLELIDAELQLLQTLCTHALATLSDQQLAAHRLRALAKADVQTQAMAKTVGVTTAVVLMHDVGRPEAFSSAGAYLKAFGLNLREKSSGKHKGRLKLSKRGPGRARRYLWLAALRLLQHDPVMRAYYHAKLKGNGARKSSAVVALMRKLAKGLYASVRSGQAFNSTKLFDTLRLQLA